MNLSKENFTEELLLEWNKNKFVNPKTKRKIKLNGPVYKRYRRFYENLINEKIKKNEMKIIDRYLTHRRNKIDPLLLSELPIDDKYNIKDLFKFKYKWNPYSGERLEKDKNGPLYFDPDTLIHYFYTDRLKELWKPGYYQNGDWYEGYYGDAVGNGPEFKISGRGKHPDWYLFRLPIPDGYLIEGHCEQSVTMGPILSDKEIKEIYKLSKRYKK